MSRPRSPHTGDLDAVLRDDLALEQIGRGRRPRGADNALKLLCAVAEDVEIRVPRRRTRGSRLTRGLLATTVAATVLGATGVAAAEPGGSGNFAFWTPRPGNHIQAADRSLTDAQRSLERGDRNSAARSLYEADKELRRAGSSTHSTALRERSSDLHDQTDKTPRPLPTTAQAGPSWSWSWGIPGGGPGWQPSKPPYKQCLLIICRTQQTPGKTSVPQQTPGAPSSSDANQGGTLSSLFRRPSSATPTTPGVSGPSPSSPESPASPGSPSVPTVTPTTPTSKPSETASSPSDSGSSTPSKTAAPRPSSSATG